MKLRKMLGKMDSPECQALMRQMETQSKQTLAAWAVAYAKERYLPLYQSAYPAEERLPAGVVFLISASTMTSTSSCLWI